MNLRIAVQILLLTELALGPALAVASVEGRACAQLFQDVSTHGFAPSLADLVMARDRWIRSAVYKRTNDLSDKEKIETAYATLRDAGVRVRLVTVAKFFGTRTEIEILPEGTARLNRIAAAVLRNYGATLRFDVRIFALGVEAGVDDSNSLVWLSKVNGYTGQLDDFLLHELRHLAMTAKEERGEPPLINGHYIRRSGLALLGLGFLLPPGYTYTLNLQELATWRQYFTYKRRAGELLMENQMISQAEFDQGMAEASRDAEPLFRDIARLISIETESIKNHEAEITYQYDSDDVFLRIRKFPVFSSHHVVPREVFRSHLPAPIRDGTPEDREEFFESAEGKIVLHQMASDFINQLQKESDDALAHILTYQRSQKQSAMPN